MKLITKCRYCFKSREIDLSAPISHFLYCSNECWSLDWINKRRGLTHPDNRNIPHSDESLTQQKKIELRILREFSK